MMNNETAPQQQQRAIALLGLAAQKTDLAGACPADETMAAFLDNRLSGKAHDGMLTHLNRCPGCYHQWLEAAAYLNEVEPTPKPSRIGLLSDIWERLKLWPSAWTLNDAGFGGWKIAVPVAAMIVLSVTLVFWPPAPDLNRRISVEYAAIHLQNAGELALIFPALPLPQDRAALGFTESLPTAPKQAFGAGVWVGRSALFGRDRVLPELLLPPAEAPWEATEWADYYGFGRWTVLLWFLANSESAPAPDWPQHQRLLKALLADLTPRVPIETEAKQAVAALQRIDALLVVIERQSNEQTRSALSRRLEITMNQLSP